MTTQPHKIEKVTVFVTVLITVWTAAAGDKLGLLWVFLYISNLLMMVCVYTFSDAVEVFNID